jgi:hypothetical protein
VNVWYVVGNLVKGTIGFRIEELITKAVRDAIEKETCVMVVRESPVP